MTPARRFPSAARTTAATSSRPRSCSPACCARVSISIGTTTRKTSCAPGSTGSGKKPSGAGTRRDRSNVLYWHWSPNNGWSINAEIRGWNECLLTYVLAASAPRYPIDPDVYHRGWAEGRNFKNGREFYGIRLPLGPDYGGPLFFAHYSFLGLDPRGLKDRYADYWMQNVNHALINREHCIRNPHGFKGYGPDCWGLTSSDDHQGYGGHSPERDLGVIAPTAALSSFPYTPEPSMRALRYFHHRLGDRIWGEYGFVDAFSEAHDWYAGSHLAIDQGPIVVMIENYRRACSGTCS